MEPIKIEENKTNQNKENVEKKLKEDLMKLFNQIKNGCYRKKCYNSFCLKSKKNPEEKNTQLPDKEILKKALTLIRSSNYEKNFCFENSEFLIKIKSQNIPVENFLMDLNERELDINEYFDLDRLPPLNLNFKKVTEILESSDLIDILLGVNKFWDFVYSENPLTEASIRENIKNKNFIRQNFFYFYMNLRLLVLVSLHPNFNYSSEFHEFLNHFFKNFQLGEERFRNFLKFYKGGYLLNFPEEANKININSVNEGNLEEIFDKEKNSKFSFKEIFEFFSNKKTQRKISGNFPLPETSEKFEEEEKNFFEKISKLNFNIKEEELTSLFLKTSNFRELEQFHQKKFFDNFSIFQNFFQFSSFIDFLSNKEKFLNIIHNYQNFLLLIIMLGAYEENEYNFTAILFNFMPVFDFFYQANEILQIVKTAEFYNEYINKNVEINFQLECKSYLKYLKSGNKSKFCWVKFFFIFDSKSKSEILFEFNCKMQRDEFFNQIANINQIIYNKNMANPYLIIEVKRENMIENSLNFLVNSQLNFKKQLKVKFIGEQGIDEGGVKKEYFLLLVRQLFNPEYGMFSYDEKNRFFWFNRNSFESTLKFELIGIVFGLAFFNSVILDVKFPLVVYKKLLKIKPNLEDLKEIDEDLYRNLRYLVTTKDQNLRNLLESNFTVTVENFGEKIIIPLKPNGEEIFIDETNRFEYVELYLDWYFNKSIEKFFGKFFEGFYRVCDDKIFHILKPEELELIICGSQVLDFFELEKSARYQDGFEENSPTIKIFWEVLHEFNEEEKKKFLLFLTGCDRAPCDGLVSKFGDDLEKIPCSHTCFNHLLLPEYKEKEQMRKKLLIAINNSEGFGLL